MVMCIFLFLLWLILNGKVTLEICLFGVVVTAAVYAFCVAALGCRPQTERRFLKRLGGYVVYGAILVREIIRANLAVMRVSGPGSRTITLPSSGSTRPWKSPSPGCCCPTPSP